MWVFLVVILTEVIKLPILGESCKYMVNLKDFPKIIVHKNDPCILRCPYFVGIFSVRCRKGARFAELEVSKILERFWPPNFRSISQY